MKLAEAGGTRRASEPVDQKQRRASLAIFARRASCFSNTRGSLALGTPQEVFPMTQTANQELTTEWLTYSGHDLAALTRN